jgi:hypothetical protein
MWCAANLNEDYIAKIEDLLETNEQPYDSTQPVVCLDEKPVTLHADIRPASAARPGREARRDNEYERPRHGQCLLSSRIEGRETFSPSLPEVASRCVWRRYGRGSLGPIHGPSNTCQLAEVMLLSACWAPRSRYCGRRSSGSGCIRPLDTVE